METAWHSKKLTELFETLRTSENGLSKTEAIRRLSVDGPNALPEAPGDSIAIIFLRQFQSPLIYVLLIAAATVFTLGETVDGVIILAVLLFNAIVGAVQEGRAEHTLRALKQYVETTATVVRDGHEMVIPDTEVVTGDIVLLSEGEKVPADARLLTVQTLKTEEASLTGESEAVSKVTDESTARVATEARNMIFKGTTVLTGSGTALVVATGTKTIIGGIAQALASLDTEMPLKADIRRLSRAIIAVIAVVSVVLFAVGLAEGREITGLLAAIISLAVSAIPEGLPIVITLVLATGVWRMSKQNALVKKLQAVEALGQADVIAVDKTGTITKNELVVREVYTGGTAFTVEGVGYEPKGIITVESTPINAANHPELLFAGKLAARISSAHVSYLEAEDRYKVSGDPTEAALRVFGEKTGFLRDELIHESPIIAEMPFDYRLKFHASLYTEDAARFVAVAGAPEVLLARSTHVYRDGKNQPMRKKDLEELETIFKNMSERGLRVVAGAVLTDAPATLSEKTVRDLSFVCFFAMQDALRSEVPDAMRRAESAGIKVVMVTGDHALTAGAIAREAGIWHSGDSILTGEEVEAMNDHALAHALDTVSVFARVTPEHKLRIIEAYKARGQVVAMTGDGVNDAPPLVAASLGVAMGKIGTEVAKEAADIVLLDDNFGSIVSAVEEGRSIYRTIKKVVLYLFSTNIGEILTIAGALFLGYPLPLLAAQIIWLNFVTDGFLDVALAMEPKESGLLSGRFRRPGTYLVDSLMTLRIAVMALPMALGTLFLFHEYAFSDIEKAWTLSLTTLAMFQWWNAWNCRSATQSLFTMNPFTNGYLIGATALVAGLQILAVYTPFFQNILQTTPLSLSEWLIIIPVSGSVIFVEEIRKFFHRRLIASRKVVPAAVG